MVGVSEVSTSDWLSNKVLFDEDLISRTEAYVHSVKALRLELQRLWVRAGRPSPKKMSQGSNVPQGAVETFLNDVDTALPSHREVAAMVKAAGEPMEVMTQWLKRVAFLEGERKYLADARRFRQLQNETMAKMVGADRTEVTTEPPAVDAPLGMALKAEDDLAYRAALRLLMENAGLSYAQVAENTKGRISKSTAHRLVSEMSLPKAENVKFFVEGCGATPEQAALWLSSLKTLQEGVNESVPVRTSVPPDGRWEWVDYPVVYLPFSGSRKEDGIEVRLRITPSSRRAMAGLAAEEILAEVLTVMSESEDEKVAAAEFVKVGETSGC